MRTPRLLDLYCGSGGAGAGYMAAGFAVTGVDRDRQDEYPGRFVQGDALAFLRAHGHEFDAVHASPPCQASSALTKGTNRGRVYEQLIPATRAELARLSVPTVMENVQGSDLRRDLTLCGEMFGLEVIRHRYFEVSGFVVTKPAHKPHRGRVRGWRHGVFHDGPYVAVYGDGGGKGSIGEWQQAMEMPWCTSRRGLADAIPPAYTRWVGEQILRSLRVHDESGRAYSTPPVGTACCAFCLAVFPRRREGRPAVFCSTRCRVASHRAKAGGQPVRISAGSSR